MIIQKKCDFILNATGPLVSKTFLNAFGDVLSLCIEGDNGVYQVEGKNGEEWYPLAGINLTDLTLVKGGFLTAGVYELGIISVRELRIRVVSTEGTVSITGEIISSMEV